MTQYVAFDEQNETLGRALLSTLEAIGQKEVQPFLEKYNINPVDPDRWYNLQTTLDLIQEVGSLEYFNLVSIGMRIPDIAEFPPDITTIDQALNLLDVAYQMNHRGGDFGSYKFEQTGERAGRMICNNPYPSDMDYGIIYGLMQKFKPEDSEFILVELDTTQPNRKTGDDTCIYNLEW